jgi:hypothetical protein
MVARAQTLFERGGFNEELLPLVREQLLKMDEIYLARYVKLDTIVTEAKAGARTSCQDS